MKPNYFLNKFFNIFGLIIFLNSSNAYSQGKDNPESGVYLQGGLASLTYQYGTRYKYDLGTTYAIYGGYNFNQNLAIEGLYATSSTANYSTTLSFGGLYLKPKLPITESIELFGRLGTNSMTISTTYNGSVTKSYPSYGGGLSIYLDPQQKYYISLEYMMWAKSGIEKLTGSSVAFGTKF